MIKSIIISIGDEILIGQIINSNASFIGAKLTALGYDVVQIISVGDDENDILDIFSYAESKADFVHITGGLGPTHDDITRKCVCEYFESKLVFNENVMQNIKSIFSNRAVKMAEINHEQALVPHNATILENELGTAPGFKLTKNNTTFYFTPGVPFEMKGIYDNHILPELGKNIKALNIFYRQINILTTGVSESALFELLGDIPSLIENCKLAFLPSPLGVKLRLSLKGDNEKLVEDTLQKIKNKIFDKAEQHIFADDETLMEEVISRLLTQKKKTLSVAESCTGGLIANKITNIPGSSNFLNRGVVSYSNESKVEILGVNPLTISKFGAVSEETAKEMALGIKNNSKSDFGLAITGIMGPDGGTETKPVGLVYIAIADESGVEVKKLQLGVGRIRNKERAAQAAFNFLRKKIIYIN